MTFSIFHVIEADINVTQTSLSLPNLSYLKISLTNSGEGNRDVSTGLITIGGLVSRFLRPSRSSLFSTNKQCKSSNQVTLNVSSRFNIEVCITVALPERKKSERASLRFFFFWLKL